MMHYQNTLIPTGTSEQFFYYTLLCAKGIGPVATAILCNAIEAAGSSAEEQGSIMLSRSEFKLHGVKTTHAEAISSQLAIPAHVASFHGMIEKGLWVVCPGSQLLPANYWNRAGLYSLPSIFIARGSAIHVKCPVAIIGSRSAKPELCSMARSVGVNLGVEGRTVVSGGAVGIDAAGVNGALSSGGTAIVVLPQGIDSANEVSQDRISASNKGELQISPFACTVPFSPGLAMARNKVIVALSEKVVAFEEDSKINNHNRPSGTQDAITHARRMEIEVVACSAQSINNKSTNRILGESKWI